MNNAARFGNSHKQNAWKSGQSGNAKGPSKDFKEVRDLCRNFGPKVIARLGEIALESVDLRAAIEASKVLLARGYGKEREAELIGDNEEQRGDGLPDVDMKSLSDDQIGRIEAILKETAS